MHTFSAWNIIWILWSELTILIRFSVIDINHSVISSSNYKPSIVVGSSVAGVGISVVVTGIIVVTAGISVVEVGSSLVVAVVTTKVVLVHKKKSDW